MTKKKLKILFSGLMFIASASFSSAIAQGISEVKNDPIADMLDRLVELKYWETCTFDTDTCALNKNKYAAEVIPEFDEFVYETRLATLDARSPFDLIYNSHVKGYIDLYASRKRNLVSRMLGMAQVYFPLFEQSLDKYDLPLELKYLAIVESALNPNAVSRSGATGLWQFMYPTGKMYGLDVTSYVDERRDPYKATEAACRYFIDLYRMFNDWQMVLAAYNGGPGTVNKAIRRSGGKKTYWEIRPYLPTETQGYVPAFIAVNYVMNYTAEHNLYPIAPKHEYFVTDTVFPTQTIRFEQISAQLQIPIEDIEFLNPGYKKGMVPYTGKEKYQICLPVSKIGQFLSYEQQIYASSKQAIPEQEIEALVVKQSKKTHLVRKGESVFGIAKKYDVTVQELKDWNNMRSNTVHPGRKLTVFVDVKESSNKAIAKKEQEPTADDSSSKEVAKTEEAPKAVVAKSVKEKSQNKFIYYTVQRGDTLWDIANRHNGVTVDQLKKMNGIHNGKSLKPGMKIKVGKAG